MDRATTLVEFQDSGRNMFFTTDCRIKHPDGFLLNPFTRDPKHTMLIHSAELGPCEHIGREAWNVDELNAREVAWVAQGFGLTYEVIRANTGRRVKHLGVRDLHQRGVARAIARGAAAAVKKGT